MKKHIGKCIYCLKSTDSLTDEHVIPYGLLFKGQDQVILEQACCVSCQKIINKVETDVLKNLLKQPRAFFGFKSRHKTHPKKYLVNIDGSKKKVSLEDISAWVMLPIFRKPHFGKKSDEGIFVDGSTLIVYDHRKILSMMKKVKIKSLGVNFKFSPPNFARFLAKVAYGFSIYQYGLDRIEKSFLNQTILGDEKSVGKWVGSIDKKLSEDRSYIFVKVGIVKGSQILCHVSLFELWGGPTYVICVGTAKSKPTK